MCALAIGKTEREIERKREKERQTKARGKRRTEDANECRRKKQ